MALPTTDPMAQLSSLLTTLGGTQQTTNAGDTTALQALLAQLQGFDPSAQLATLYQQAAGNIPGLATAYGNAVGARRTNNSGVQNALNALMSQVTTAGQKQVADQQLQAMQTQANVAGNIAQTTQGTKKTTSTDMGSVAKNLLIMQGLAKLGDTDIGKQLFGNVGKTLGINNTTQPTSAPAATAPAVQQSAAPLMSAAPAQGVDLVSLLQGAASAPEVSTMPVVPQTEDYGMSLAPAMPDFNIRDFLGTDQSVPEMSMAPEDWFDQPDVMSYFQ